MKIICFILCATTLTLSDGFAAPFRLQSFKTMGGGGESFGNGFKISGSIGQPVVNSVATTSGALEAIPGFWPAAALVPPSEPGYVSVRRLHDGSVRLGWGEDKVVLESAPTIAGPWTQFSSGTTNVVIMPAAGEGAMFFRLRR